jgi:hypothetical protein
MSHELLLPLAPDANIWDCPLACELSCARVNSWIGERVERARLIFERPDEHCQPSADTMALACSITEILTQRVFNFQPRSRLTSQILQVRENLVPQLLRGDALNFFLLYNGGYRSSPLRNGLPLIFEPDQTELMLLYQIALLHEKVRAVHLPGIKFFIVINNGVGLWVNDIPVNTTSIYVSQLRKLIDWLGAAGAVEVLVQSELPGFTARPILDTVISPPALSDKEHQLVERFLGRICSPEEARYRHALYALAEAKWALDLSGLAATREALILRQIAHPDMLSFRPFPGGAIRIQNGSLGFEHRSSALSPKLITSETAQQQEICWVPWSPPWSAPTPASKTATT